VGGTNLDPIAGTKKVHCGWSHLGQQEHGIGLKPVEKGEPWLQSRSLQR
jgi:hypothetical protein